MKMISKYREFLIRSKILSGMFAIFAAGSLVIGGSAIFIGIISLSFVPVIIGVFALFLGTVFAFLEDYF